MLRIMNRTHAIGLFLLGGFWWILAGCSAEDSGPTGKPTSYPTNKTRTSAKESKKVPVGNNVFLEIDGKDRRVLVQAQVCLRQGALEQLLTRKRTKEHEAVLAADVDAQNIHAALLLAGAEKGSPVKFLPQFEVARGQPIQVTLEYNDPQTKQLVRVNAKEWILRQKDKKPLPIDWVFAGSIDVVDPLDKTKKPYYAANDGDVICVSNFDTALLDLPINSSKGNEDLAFEANTAIIPPLETPVLVILEPMPARKN